MKNLLNACRYLIWGAVIGCLVLTLGAITMGVGRVFIGFVHYLSEGDFSSAAARTISIRIIEIVGLFLVATVAYIAAVGLYKIFINKDFKLPGLIRIRNLNELESKMTGLVVAALGVSFLGQVAEDSPKDILNIGIGIAAVIIALAVFVTLTSGKHKPGNVWRVKETEE